MRCIPWHTHEIKDIRVKSSKRSCLFREKNCLTSPPTPPPPTSPPTSPPTPPPPPTPQPPPTTITHHASAGVIPYSKDGFWLGKMAQGYCDFGGKKAPGDSDTWDTAKRELKEETGTTVEMHTHHTCHPERRHVVYCAPAENEPAVQENEKKNIPEIRFVKWDEYRTNGLPSPVHPRLKFDYGGEIKRSLTTLAQQKTRNNHRHEKRCTVPSMRHQKDTTSAPEISDTPTEQLIHQPVALTDTYCVHKEPRQDVLRLREDVDDMRMVYYLRSLTCEEYIRLNPHRGIKLELEKRDLDGEYSRLQALLREIINGKTHRTYKHAGEKKYGRLYSSGLQNAWSEVRGLLSQHLTDADMVNCHPRILLWICDTHGIDATNLRSFVSEREGIYKAITGAKYNFRNGSMLGCSQDADARRDAKGTVLAMMNDEQHYDEHNKLQFCDKIQQLEAEFKRLQRAVCALPQYADLSSDAKEYKMKLRRDGTMYKKYNKLGSWLNLILCKHENEFLHDARLYIDQEHGIETATLMFDGLMMYGNYYDREEDICEELRKMLYSNWEINMPWTFKPHSDSLQQCSIGYQTYPIPYREYLLNIADTHFRTDRSLAHIISGLRGEYERSSGSCRSGYKAAAQSLMIRSHRCMDEFSKYWDAPFGPLSAEVLKYYSRESNEDNHIHHAKAHLQLLGKDCFSEADLRNYFIEVFGDNLLVYKAIDGDKVSYIHYIWSKNWWQLDERDVLQYVVMEMVRKLYASSITYYTKELHHLIDSDYKDKDEHEDQIKKLQCKIQKLAHGLKMYGCSLNRNVSTLISQQMRYNAVTDDPFDRNPYLFCFTNAVYDIQKDAFTQISKYDYCQMTCGKAWRPPIRDEMQRVKKMFEDILDDEEIRRGYVSVLKSGFTGIRDEHFILANGSGGNGKGVLNEHATNAIGDYFMKGHLETLTKPQKSGGNPEAASMHRKRLVLWSEPEEGAGEGLRLSCIKDYTGCPSINARMNYSNRVKAEMHLTCIMECNKPPVVVGKKDDSATRRFRVFLFPNVFTENADLVGTATPTGGTYKLAVPMGDIKGEVAKEKLRCATFMYIMKNGGDTPWFPERTKIWGEKYLAENDDMSIWFQDHYEYMYEHTDPVTHFVAIKDMWATFQNSNAYMMMNKEQKRTMTQSKFTEDIKANLLLKKFFREPKKAYIQVKGLNGCMKQNSRAGVIHYRPKNSADDDDTI